MNSHNLNISFPSEAALKRFKGWMSDGGGEYQFMDCEDDNDEVEPADKIGAFEYDGNQIIAKCNSDMSDDELEDSYG